MTTIQDTVRKQLLRFIVQRNIFCPVSGRVLDMDTCGYFVDADGDPAYVVDPQVYDAVLKDGQILASLAEKGLHPHA